MSLFRKVSTFSAPRYHGKFETVNCTSCKELAVNHRFRITCLRCNTAWYLFRYRHSHLFLREHKERQWLSDCHNSFDRRSPSWMPGMTSLRIMAYFLARAGGATFANKSVVERNNRRHTVKVLCAWCVRDGRPALLREKGPLTDARETHGLCGEHFAALLAGKGKLRSSRSGLLAPVNDLCCDLTRRGQRFVNRVLCTLC